MQTSKPNEVLQSFAAKHGVDVLNREFAELMDSLDPLRGCRERFAIPKRGTLPGADPAVAEGDKECIYLCGNSLGLKPVKADRYIQDQLDKWARMGVEMHFEEPLPAAKCDSYLREELGRLVGADPSSVCLMNGLTVNLHLLLLSFYQPTQTRFKILLEGHAFPSDRYAMRSQAELRGFDPNEAVLEINPREGESTLRTEDILKVIREQGSSIAVVCLSGVQYYTGQKFDMETITKAAREEGCLVGWDVAHAVGNVRLELDKWGVDFACWCTYKYLNSGPGCIGGAYVNKRHEQRDAPHLKGWWSNKESTRFQMRDGCDTAPGIDGFRLCNPPPILVALVKASLEIFDEVGMDKILDKQFLLTGYLELLLKAHFSIGDTDVPTTTIITPEDVNERGSQLSLEFSYPLHQVHKELQKRGVVCDVRLPNAMRITPAPLYNSFQDVHYFITILQDVFSICKTEAA
ncbi:kynureninase-like [Penaeus chinensis]|uniref:kynureninase-like n=1 Tax=Penaeus chinensis TaxID=139456 RepID=UPI001FB696D9|nr:kynureninase-like [Penaeus chinensis]